jgi:hypothetical protein
MTKAKLVKELKAIQTKLSNKFNEDVCENWSLEGFLEHIDDCICDIEEEELEEEED